MPSGRGTTAANATVNVVLSANFKPQIMDSQYAAVSYSDYAEKAGFAVNGMSGASVHIADSTNKGSETRK